MYNILIINSLRWMHILLLGIKHAGAYNLRSERRTGSLQLCLRHDSCGKWEREREREEAYTPHWAE